jgi:hypothetical protein
MPDALNLLPETTETIETLNLSSSAIIQTLTT